MFKWMVVSTKKFYECSGCFEKIYPQDRCLMTDDGVFCEECGEIEEKNQENMSDEFSRFD